MSTRGPVGVGLIGAGNISGQYLRSLTSFPDLKVHIVGDLDTDRARAQADEYSVPRSGTAADVLAHDDVEIVVNLTLPAAHADVSSRALSAGKHVWSEKPLAIDRDSAHSVLDQAATAGLRVGVAPDTVLGPAVQTARRALARGDIGRPLSAQTVMQYAGPDAWHPSPEFLFAKGAGPLFDMGPYYITTLLNLFGPASASPPWVPPVARCGPYAPATGPGRASTSRCPRTSPRLSSSPPGVSARASSASTLRSHA
ncbi:Gfo/Idh/MocA family protein [Streptomyces sp. NPDC057293]|uniref:Gfo/Idh/MocA family protein n=1 Tax=unclassified Streptomyces TaxID=2593676 RepID=UPI003632368D